MQITLSNISKSYHENQQVVLNDVSLTINPGDSIAITGPSGSGKSTLLNILGTLDVPTSGKVLFNNEDITTFEEKALARIRNKNIGFIFQMHHLLPQLNLLENVLMPVIPQRKNVIQSEVVSRAKELLDKVGLGGKLYQVPGQLSVGECQRAAVVRALINKPEVILADEPTGSLDHESAEKLGDLLLYLQKEYSLALVLVTHSTELAKRMHTIYTLINGKLLAC